MKKKYYVGICKPYFGMADTGKISLCWDVAENVDYLSPDLMAKVRGIEVPLITVEAKNETEAVRIYKEIVPQTKNWRLRKGWLPA